MFTNLSDNECDWCFVFLGVPFYFRIEVEPKPVLKIVVHILIKDVWIL